MLSNEINDAICSLMGFEEKNYINDLNHIFSVEQKIGLHNTDFKGRKLRRAWKQYANKLNYDESFCNALQRSELVLRILNLYNQ